MATTTSRYGVYETNNIADAPYTSEDVNYLRYTPLNDPELVSIDRLRLLTEAWYPYYDISYCWGTLKDGTHVRVDLGTGRLRKDKAKSEGGRGKRGRETLLAPEGIDKVWCDEFGSVMAHLADDAPIMLRAAPTRAIWDKIRTDI